MPTLDYQPPQAPSNWRIFHMRDPATDRFTIRPLGFRGSGHGRGLLILAIMGCFVACIGLCGLVTLRDPQMSSSFPRSATACVALGVTLLGLVFAAAMAYLAYTSTSLIVTRATLQVTRRGPLFGSRTHIWPLQHIQRFEMNLHPEADGNDWIAASIDRLEIRFRNGESLSLLTGYGHSELAYLADHLNQLLTGRR